MVGRLALLDPLCGLNMTRKMSIEDWSCEGFCCYLEKAVIFIEKNQEILKEIAKDFPALVDMN